MTKKRLDHGWKMVDLSNDGDLVAQDSQDGTTAWVEEIDGIPMLAVGDADGVAAGYVPLSVVDQLRK